MPTLVLIRHGQSAWNLENRFTGWWDVDVTAQGAAEARAKASADAGLEGSLNGDRIDQGGQDSAPVALM